MNKASVRELGGDRIATAVMFAASLMLMLFGLIPSHPFWLAAVACVGIPVLPARHW